MMEEQWSQMTPAEKREQRLNWWRQPDVSFDNEKAAKDYQLRVERMIAAYNVEEPDRVPVALPVGSLPATLYGVDYFTCSYDYEKAVEVWNRFNEEFKDADSIANPAMIIPARVYDLLGYQLYKYPGHGLPKTATGVQFVEGEYMKVEEYDQLINNPSDFWMRTYMPRVFGLFEPWRMLSSFTTIIELPATYFMPFSHPDMQQSLATLTEVGNELKKYMKIYGEFSRRGTAAGYPAVRMGMAKAPFDTLGDTLRGTQGIIKDMYRCPEKLKEALEVVTKFTIDQTLATMRANKGLIVRFPLHKGADGWMSDKQFQTFYWPSLKKVCDALIADGIIVNLFAEGSFETRLDSVNCFPKGTVSWMFDKTDMAKAKKALGNNCCISGNVPTSLIVTGTPEQVKEYSRKLIETCAPGGGYILTGGAQADSGKKENFRAMLDAAYEYGVYKK